MSLATINGAACIRARVCIPASGMWFADVECEDSAVVPAGVPATLLVGDAVCTCTPLSGGNADGVGRYRLIGGRGGWGRSVPAAGYLDDAGVKVQTLAQDAATAVGELLGGVPTTARVGPHFARLTDSPASAVLHAVAPRAWYVGLDGVTLLGLRPEAQYVGTAIVMSRESASRTVELAFDGLGVGIGALVPGVRIGDAEAATDVEWIVEPTSCTVRVSTGPTAAARMHAAFAKILDALDPSRRYRGAFEFRVVQQAGERLHLQPARSASGMPDLLNVHVRPGVAGCRATVLPGSLVVVQFLDADPSRPVVIAHDSAESPAWAPLGLTVGGSSTLALDLGGPGGLGVARMTDPVIAGPFAGTIVSGSLRVKASL